jgi:hypothetical protein
MDEIHGTPEEVMGELQRIYDASIAGDGNILKFPGSGKGGHMEERKVKSASGAVRAKETYDVAPILALVRSTRGKRVVLDGDTVNVSSLRMRCFKAHGVVCKACGLDGTYFRKERHSGQDTYHLNLYGVNKSGHEVMLTADHVQAVGVGGRRYAISNLQTMCHPCNNRKGDGLCRTGEIGRRQAMGKVYSGVEGLKAPDYGTFKGDYDEYFKAQEKYLEDLKEWARKNGSGPEAGKEVTFPVADGHAVYVVVSLKPVKLVHVATGDAWHYEYVDRLTAVDLRKRIKSQEALDKLFRSRREAG